MHDSDYNVDEPNYRGPGMYRHYKGGSYFVYGLALQEDHKDRTYVVYKPMTAGSLLEDRPEDFWARELGDFNAVVVLDGAVPCSQAPRVPRFEFVSPV